MDIYLSSDSVLAHDTPSFILLKDGVYYITKAIWHYDLSQAENQEQIDGFNAVKSEYDSLGSAADVAARIRNSSPGSSDPNECGGSV